MQTITQVLEKNLKMESESNICTKCAGKTSMKVNILGVDRIVPVMCACKQQEYEETQARLKADEKQVRLKQLFTNSLMDNQFQECTFEKWDINKGSDKILKITKNYAEKFQELKSKNVGLLIHGIPGNGKTYATSCIANNLLERQIPVICVSINSLLDRIKQTFSSYGKEGEETILRGLRNADLLILDDLGTENSTDWSRTTIYNIIDSRYRDNKPLIISTNFTLDEIKEKYNDRTYNRIIEMCTPVKNEWRSIRIDKAREKTLLVKELIS